MDAQDLSQFNYFLDAVRASPQDADRLVAAALESDPDVPPSDVVAAAIRAVAKILKPHLPTAPQGRLSPEQFHRLVEQALQAIGTGEALPAEDREAVQLLRRSVGR